MNQLFILAPMAMSSLIFLTPQIAHNVQTAEDVAVTFHIEPDHNPRVGKETLAWFALTRRGGKPISLSECDCYLAVYTLPRTPQAQPLLNPELEAINVERFVEIPGATLIFPKVGAYELEIRGTPRENDSFQPFKFTYTVNVAP